MFDLWFRYCLALAHLCEFIEDCEFSTLAAEILDLLGREGPKTSTPSRYVRYIYNRYSQHSQHSLHFCLLQFQTSLTQTELLYCIFCFHLLICFVLFELFSIILENPLVRAAAIQALAKFGALVPPLRENILTLLKRFLHLVHSFLECFLTSSTSKWKFRFQIALDFLFELIFVTFFVCLFFCSILLFNFFCLVFCCDVFSALHDEDDEVRDRVVLYTTLLSSESNLTLLRELLVPRTALHLLLIHKRFFTCEICTEC